MAQGLLFSAAETPLHRLNPLTKLAGLVWLASLVIVLPWQGAWAIAILIGLGAAASVGLPVVKRLLAIALPFSVAVFAVQGFLLAHTDTQPLAGPIAFSHEGVLRAASVAGRVSAIVAASLLFSATTHPATLLRAGDAAGWPPAFSYLMASPLLMLETFHERAAAIRAAQETRGLRLRGSWRAGVTSLPALVLPLITTALIDVDERSRVLVARGFRAHPRRMTIDKVADSVAERILRPALLCLAAVQATLLIWS
jgi:energy-coupling factor transporter transmembrane protein EcfT